MEISEGSKSLRSKQVEFVHCPSKFSLLTISMSLITNTKYTVFLSICLIPAKRFSGSLFKYIALLFYCIYRLTWYWLCFIIRNMGLLLSLKSLNSSGKSTLSTHRLSLLVCIFVVVISVKKS
jgi:hypothetical protein